jgi:molybdopterin molybdotransferase
MRIMTGAPVPPGADAIVPVENTTEGDGVVTVGSVATVGDHIRPAGDDVREGDVVVSAGSELGAGELALLASLGLTPVPAHRRPRVAILATGDELVAPDIEPGPGQIRDSNSLALSVLVSEAGGEPRVIGPVADEREAVEIAVDNAMEGSDLIVSSGGVSVGKYDFVRDVVMQRGQVDFWRVAMQPGKPVVSGKVKDVPFLGLPGNPVSIHIGFEQFVRPAIRKMRGCSELLRPTLTARLAERIEKRPGRLHFVRVRLESSDEGFVARPIGRQGSHIQSSLVNCHGVARFPIEGTVFEVGDDVTVEVWRLP